jgi:hypothetical protein
MPISFSPTTRFIGVPRVTDAGGRELFEIREPIEFVPVSGMVKVQMRASDTLHSLATAFWSDARLWWVLADFNGIFDVTTELFEGKEIFVPPIDFVRDALIPRIL